MKISELGEVKRQLKAGKLAPIYFLYGNEPYLINHCTKLIEKAAVTALPEINLKIIDSDFDIDEIASNAYQVPMMSIKKCIILSDFELSKLSQKQLSALIELAENPSDVAVIIFKFTRIELSFTNKYKMKAQSKNYQAVAKAIENGGGVVAEINRMTTGDIVKTICSGATRRGCTLDFATARYMVERCSDDLTVLLGETEKLCAYKQSGEITKTDIDKLCIKSFQAVIFDMAKSVLANDIKTSLTILDSLLFQHVSELEILRELEKSYIDIFRIYTARASGIPNDAVAKDFDYGARSFVLRTAASYAAKLSREQISDCLTLHCETEYKLKGGSRLPKSDILRTLITELVMIFIGVKRI